MGLDDDRHRRGALRRSARARLDVRAGGRGARSSTDMLARRSSRASTRRTSPRSGSSAARSCATPAVPGSRTARSRRSTSRSGICARACSTCRSSRSSLPPRPRAASTAAAASARTRSSGSREQLGGWVAQGIPRVKMKLGREPAADPRGSTQRARRSATTELYVDANGAFSAKEARPLGATLRRRRGTSRWFEEPVSSADFDGLRLVREHATLDVAAGEYAYVLADFRNLIGYVDCLQADVTRCGGITGLLRVNGLAAAHGLDLSGHCAPQLVGARALRRRPAAPPRVLPRPRAHRVDALRRRARAGRRRARPRPLAAGTRPRAEARRGAAVGGMIAAAREHRARDACRSCSPRPTAMSAPALGLEIYFEHYKGSFGDKWMWTPLVLTPPLTAAGVAGFVSREGGAHRAARGVGAVLPRRGRSASSRTSRACASARAASRRRTTTSSWGRRCSRRGRSASSARSGWPPRSSSARDERGTLDEARPNPHHLRQREGHDAADGRPLPDYDVLAETGHWDEVTRRVVLDRVENVPPIRFFDAAEARHAEGVLRRRDGAGRGAAHPGARRTSTRSSSGG